MLERHPGVVLERHTRLLERQYAGKASGVLERHTRLLERQYAGKAFEDCWKGSMLERHLKSECWKGTPDYWRGISIRMLERHLKADECRVLGRHLGSKCWKGVWDRVNGQEACIDC
jgi:hypothetical protein